MNEMEYTGERMTSTYDSFGGIEHLHRYALVKDFLKSDMIIVDVACGEGYGTNLMSKFVKKAIGVDISNDAILHARAKYKKTNIEFIQASAQEIPIENSSIDLIVSFETIEHLEDHNGMLKEFKRILKAGGSLVISTPDKSKYSIGNPNPYHVKELSYDDFKRLLGQFFLNVNFYLQKTIHGSLIYSQDNHSQLTLHRGNFKEIANKTIMDDYEFIIALASDISLNCFLTSTSFFDAEEIFSRENIKNLELKRKYYELVMSKKFKIINRILKLFQSSFKLK